jgi:ring-1,2-phenylacetyl-CoA epoxidase subunit PaaC
MNNDDVYEALNETHAAADARWAFGTGFEDPLHGVDTQVPAGVDRPELIAYCLALGDDALISAQRLAQWCTRAPELEEETALANIGLDLLGQARLLLSRAGQVEGAGRDEDALAYFRDAAEFRNVRLAELPNRDFAFSVVRLLILSTWRLALFGRLTGCADPVLAAIAAKGVNELAYHREYAAQWAIRLGNGTEESHERMRRALDAAAPWLDELFDAEAGFGVEAATTRDEVEATLRLVVAESGLSWPAGPATAGGGRDGAHTEHLAPLVAELQVVARAHPDATW